MQHRAQLALAVALLGLFAAPAHAQSGDGLLQGMLRQCALIADIPARAACYDAIPRGEPEATASAVAPPAPPQPPGRLGSDQLPTSRASEADEPEAIETKVIAAMEREPGIHLLTLETGDQWLFVQGAPGSYIPPTNGSVVRIRSAPLGGYLLRYQGQSAVRVQRVR
jgi:hypothetical protein